MTSPQRSLAPSPPTVRWRDSDPRFLPREAQDTLAARIAQAVDGRETLVAEAGTGVGKTFAYLVPLLLSGRRALISTATKSLQDQLFLRDLPRLRDALRRAGAHGAAEGPRQLPVPAPPEPGAARARSCPTALRCARCTAWHSGRRPRSSGDLAEIEGLDDRSPVIPLVTSTRDNCLGSDCPEFRACHVMQARREAMAADLVVVNHHLFFADMALRDSGVAELLPTVDAAVFDEAHQLVEAGVQFLGTTLATGAGDRPGARPAGRRPGARARPAALERAAGAASSAPRANCGWPAPARCARCAAWSSGAGKSAATRPRRPCRRWPTPHSAAATGAGRAWPRRRPTFRSSSSARARWRALAARFGDEAAADHVRWIDLTPQQARLVESPLDIRDMLTEQRAAGADGPGSSPRPRSATTRR